MHHDIDCISQQTELRSFSARSIMALNFTQIEINIKNLVTKIAIIVKVMKKNSRFGLM